MAFELIVHPEARQWTPTESDLRKMRAFFKAGRIHILPRSLANKTLGKDLPPYAFRAFTRGNDSYVFVDGTETKASISFLIAHELTHRMVHDSPTLMLAFADARLPLAGHSDDFHQIDAEERFCDGIAGRLLGTWHDRAWWRGRIPRRRVA